MFTSPVLLLISAFQFNTLSLLQHKPGCLVDIVLYSICQFVCLCLLSRKTLNLSLDFLCLFIVVCGSAITPYRCVHCLVNYYLGLIVGRLYLKLRWVMHNQRRVVFRCSQIFLLLKLWPRVVTNKGGLINFLWKPIIAAAIYLVEIMSLESAWRLDCPLILLVLARRLNRNRLPFQTLNSLFFQVIVD